MGTKVDKHASADDLFHQSPLPGPLWIDVSRMQIETAKMKYGGDKIRVDQLLRFHDGWNESVLGRDLMLEPRLIRRSDDFLRLGFVVRQRLLTIHMLAVLECRNHRVF